MENILRSAMHRVDVIEKQLSTHLLSFESRDKLESELENIKEVLRKNEEKLKKLRMNNAKTFAVVGCVIFLSFLLFGIYNMFFRKLWRRLVKICKHIRLCVLYVFVRWRSSWNKDCCSSIEPFVIYEIFPSKGWKWVLRAEKIFQLRHLT